jgi:hypothetical protein
VRHTHVVGHRMRCQPAVSAAILFLHCPSLGTLAQAEAVAALVNERRISRVVLVRSDH